MATIVTRAGKGLELTKDEVDANFNNLNSTKIENGYNAILNTVSIQAINVNSGAINGTAIGLDTADAGNFTTLIATGGAINGATIGATTPSTGAFTNLTATGTVTLNGTTISAGLATISGGIYTLVDINSGSIDGTAIGVTTPDVGIFSNLSAAGTFTSRGIDDNADAVAVTIDASENVNLSKGNGDGLGITFGSTTYVAAQTLDWVEKKTSFSPVLSDASTGGNLATVTTTRAYFTRIANMVCVDLEFIGINTTGMTPTNSLFIQGLPFPGSALMTQFCPVAEVVDIAARPATAKQAAINVGAVTYASLTQSGVGGGAATTLVSDLTSGTARFRTVFTYFVD